MNKDDIFNALVKGATAAPPLTHKEVVKIAAPKINVSLKPIAIAKPKEEKANEDLIGPVPLGYDKSYFYYLSQSTMQVHEVAASNHGPNTLMAMASMSYWLQRFKGSKGVDWHAATDFVMTSCRKVGVYNPEAVRGRGVAFDKGRVVLHLGSRLIVDGVPQSSLLLDDSQYIYEKSRTLSIDLGEPLNDEEAYRIIEIASMFSWATNDMGLLFAGWLVGAPVCGALPWRTHLWLTGERGSGKSWIMTNFVQPLIGPLGFYVQSKTTEAGIRQHLRVDARPVIFDESESQSDQDRARLQQVLDIARQASSDDGFQILKGTANGKEMRFKIHSSFLFSSINYGAVQSADESRIIPIALVPLPSSAENSGKFDQIREAVSSVITPEFSGRLLARTLHLLPVIRANIKTFSRALSETMTSRQADTIGSVVACVYSLFSSRKLTADEALNFVKDKTWIRTTATRTETEADHDKAVSHLMQQLLRITPSHEISIAEAIKIAGDDPHHEQNKILARNGMRVRDGALYIARSHHVIDKFFEQTPWARVWDRIILQYPGATAGEKTTDFAGYKKKPVIIPLEALIV